MKKLAALLLTLALMLTCAAAETDTSWTDYSVWVCDRARIEVGFQDDDYKVTVMWGNSAFETNEWTYHCDYDPDTNTLTSTLGRLDKVTWNEDGEVVSEDEIYADGQATFTVNENGMLIWTDGKEDAGQGMAFERAAADTGFAAAIDQDGNVYDLFEIRRLNQDEAGKVVSVTGRYERVGEDKDGTEVPFFDETEYTFPLAADAVFEMLPDPLYDPLQDPIRVDDLIQWYIDAYLEGNAPAEGRLVFAADLPQEQQDDADFYSIHTKIKLNETGEITLIRSVYTPWQ